MTRASTDDNTIKPTDLRGILKYVPMFREHVFVIAIDGSLVADEIFPNVLLDIAVLRSLNIKVVLVHGIGQQLRELAADRDIPISDAHGEGSTDDATLALATELSSAVSLEIVQGLTRNQLRCAVTNAVRSKEAGIVKGQHQLHSGVVDKIDISMLNQMLESQTVPVVTPIAFNREGGTLRLNSDLLAAELAAQLDASKLIYLTTQDGLPQANLPVADLVKVMEESPEMIPDRLTSKARFTVRAIRAGVPRAHILDGRIFGALLNEIFDKVGVGTMVYSNDYESIRQAVRADAYAIYNITRNGVRSETLRERSHEAIEADIENFLVYEIDGSIVGCVHLQRYDDGQIIEIGSVYVQSFYQNKGVGRRMIEYACTQAGAWGASQILAMSTQATGFFTRICGFREASIENLPEARRASYQASGRNSNILIKDID
ncbi:amino-acid N-acetyltransferase [Coraliomargarita akajimensis]|uniref:amino-acid N-acetyltransferase n=1 Tax=Coraliomargarita akajimensis (strain DSM 45221 / IAM 15411 / JCM 23193 / KCTC 12865 / 04OKA010-24) TaxID=583355 RepID=D5EQ28_CORAD|nr:amino-acid N-acetyltransferase [Coraliomargarita akajimensis]ADE53796.1 amino-acid N-acetyltransferase [Coraliomargarita akajimensis DSM 45221]